MVEAVNGDNLRVRIIAVAQNSVKPAFMLTIVHGIDANRFDAI